MHGKVATGILVVLLALGALSQTAQAAEEGRGGPMGFIAGCCFGLRAGIDYNDGKELLWREYVRVVPVVGFVVALWDGFDCYNGMTRAQLAEQYGSTYY